jgi:hypothetical protein
MAKENEVFELHLLIRKSPKSIRAWWTDLPDDYQANDPREQPYRIVTLRRTPNGRELRTYWRLPDGSTRDWQELLTMKPDGSWTFEIPNHPAGLHILDEFRTESAPEGTVLHIRSTLTAREASAAGIMAAQKERMTNAWKIAIEICEREAS